MMIINEKPIKERKDQRPDMPGGQVERGLLEWY